MGPNRLEVWLWGKFLEYLRLWFNKNGAQFFDAWRLIGDASRLAFADRGRYIADSDFVSVPVKGLLNKISKKRSTLLNRKKRSKCITGNPSFHTANSFADDESIELPSTSHISIVDQYGNADPWPPLLKIPLDQDWWQREGFYWIMKWQIFFSSHQGRGTNCE